uniref:GPI inositol-deacylase n=1 Tax=Lutzomyia longipalpis TaxID=7200 RepID=A0A1B0CWU5_LUTLO
MTYMYEYPQFVRINFRENKRFPKYNLYGYAEGHLTEFARNGDWNGAPVLFIPGNSGSYKQARSLASVALRKGLDNNWAHHLDYFTVDLNEEYSALFGGVLEEQTEFVGQCIKEILNLYSRLPNRPRSITIVGHSMGGTIAYALLRNTEVAPLIGTIIALSAPLDKPVINFDVFINAFYRSIREKMQESRQVRLIGNHTNTCCANKVSRAPQNLPPKGFDDKLLISIGGGSRDIIVHAGHSDSIYSDIHAMSTSIPLVWLTTDHLCAVWCLQSVLVLNRFLYSTIRPVKGREAYGKGHQFIDDKEEKLAKAIHYFTNKSPAEKHHKEVILVSGDKVGEWIEDSRRVFTHQFKNGLNTTRFQMIRLIDLPQYQLLNVEAINLADKDWVFGCAALDVLKTMRYCAKAVSITEYAEKLPSLKHERFHLRLDLKKLKAKHPEWTHVVIGIWPTKQPVQINVDIHAEGDREVKTSIQKWYHYTPQTIIEDTILGSSVYKLSIHGLEVSHQAMELVVKPKSCSKPGYHSVAKICVPWTEGLILACFIYFGLITKMYEGYLEEFIFNTAKEIAEKLYGRWRRRTSGAVEGETNPIASTIEGAIENSNVESLENSEASPEQDASGNPEETEPQLVPEAIEANAENVTSAESTTDSQVNSSDTKEDPELNRLLEDSLRQQMKYEEKRKKDEEVLRVEYDAIPEGLSSINFHLCLFFILLLLTFINLPTALTWSKKLSIREGALK